MIIPGKVLNIAQDIKDMKIRGAGKIARSAASALIIAAEEYSGEKSVNAFKKYMYRVAELLIKTRPTAVSLPNAVFYILHRMETASGGFTEVRDAVIKAGNEFIENSLKAVEKISDFGAKRIKEDSIVLTHCHSSASVAVITKAYEMGKVKLVYSTETRPFYQGRITARALIEKGVPVVQIPDSAVRTIIHHVDHVVIGADTIASNGAVINKIGTSQIALAAHEARVRVYVASETYKFSPLTIFGELVEIEYRDPTEIVPRDWIEKHPRVRVLNPSFDVTPPEYIDAIITEIGVIPPQAAIMILLERFGWFLEKFKLGGVDNIIQLID